MSLEEYKKKRNFQKTSEPSGGGCGRGEGLKFVVQKHEASHLHYDFRLEAGGVLKSWAVPKGPSLDPEKRSLAIMVEDHPLDYADFEGVIPAGNYGAGTVMVWDAGRYSVPGLDRAESERKVLEGIEAGNFSVFLEGSKLKGEFALARVKGKEKDWLLIKKKDRYAGKEGEASDRSAKTGRSMEEIASARPETVPELDELPEEEAPDKIRPMLARSVKDPFDRNGWLFELKIDGYRALAIVKEGVDLYSRNGLSFNERFSSLVPELRKMDFPAVLDGEIAVLDERGAPDFLLLLRFIKEGRGSPVFFVFDLLYYQNRSLLNLPLRRRKEILKRILPISSSLRYLDHVDDEGVAFFRRASEEGVEGIMAKDSSSPYLPGERSGYWLKIKSHLTQEAVIGGFTEARGGRKFFGALILGVYEKGSLVYIGHTGGGFAEEQLASLRSRLDQLRQEDCPFETEPKTNAPATWVKPSLVCEIRFGGWTEEGVMRQPIFVALREDKSPFEAAREIPEETEEALKDMEDLKFEISHPDKVWWPEEGYKKRDLVAYYEAMADTILPYLKDRPESLHRFPDGIGGGGFYQKNIIDKPDWLPTIKIFSESENRDINYLICQDKDALIYMANLGCIEINPWNSRIDGLDSPDYMALDLDPQDLGFTEVVKVALATRDVLEDIDARGFCKTSGATGLHIYVPMAAKYNYDHEPDEHS